MKRIRAVIVGGGPSGLATAIMLQQTGLETYLLEKNPQRMGGLAQGWIRNYRLADGRILKAIYETTTAVSNMMPGQPTYEMFEELGLEWKHMGRFEYAPGFMTMLTSKSNGDGHELKLMQGFEENTQHLKSIYPKHKPAIEKIIGKYKRVFKEISSSEGCIASGDSVWEHSMSIVSNIMEKPTMVWHIRDTLDRVLRKYIKGNSEEARQLRAHLSFIVVCIGLAPTEISYNVIASMLATWWGRGGVQIPMENSFQALHDEMERVLVKNDDSAGKTNGRPIQGRIMKGAEVTRLHMGDREHGISYSKGGRMHYLPADIIVIASNLDILKGLRNEIPSKFIDQLEAQQISTPMYSMHAVLQGGLEDIAEMGDVTNSIMFSSLDGLDRCLDPASPEWGVSINVPTVLRPGAGLLTYGECREAASTNEFNIVHAYGFAKNSFDRWMEWRRTSPKTYRKEKQKLVDECLTHAEEMIPDLRKRIVRTAKGKMAIDTATPRSFYNKCRTREGAALSAAMIPRQAPPFGLPIRIREGLYGTGSQFFAPGLGTAYISAKMTAQAIKSDQ